MLQLLMIRGCISVRKIGPIISNAWSATKAFVATTPAKPILFNGLIAKTESMIDTTSDKLVAKMVEYRNNLLPLELKYLEQELEKVKKEVETLADKTIKTADEVKDVCEAKDSCCRDDKDDHKI